jgi:nucleotidyltransferase substrate binding protein (TIGR01987 family)
MSDINLNALTLAVTALEERLSDYEYARDTKSRLLLSVRDGVIQRFEVTIDIARQLLIRILKEIYGEDDTTTHRHWIRDSAKFGIITDAEIWIAFLNARNETSHTYDANKANAVFEQIPVFLSHIRDVLESLPKHVS